MGKAPCLTPSHPPATRTFLCYHLKKNSSKQFSVFSLIPLFTFSFKSTLLKLLPSLKLLLSRSPVLWKPQSDVQFSCYLSSQQYRTRLDTRGIFSCFAFWVTRFLLASLVALSQHTLLLPPHLTGLLMLRASGFSSWFFSLVYLNSLSDSIQFHNLKYTLYSHNFQISVSSLGLSHTLNSASLLGHL